MGSFFDELACGPQNGADDQGGLSPWRTRQLWSLWAMLSRLENVVLLFSKLSEIESTLRSVAQNRGTDFTTSPMAADDPLVIGLKAAASNLSLLPSMSAMCGRLADLWMGGATISKHQAAMEQFRQRAEDEAKLLHVYWVRPELIDCYEKPQLFGQEVNDKFPEAIDDIEGAGKCLALGQGTAVVLHLMRVMECGLKALAKSLKIPYAPSWESYLTQIQTRIGAKYKTKGVQWKRDEPFYRDASGDLISVKQAFRNPTMHVVRKYAPEEAAEIFASVRTFMRRLAKDLPATSSRVGKKDGANPSGP